MTYKKKPEQQQPSLDEREQREWEYIKRDYDQQNLDDDDDDRNWNRTDDWTDFLQDNE